MKILRVCLLCVLTSLLVGSNCEDTEILGPVALDIASDSDEASLVIRLPFVGRTSLDWTLRNNGDSQTEFTLLALSQQDEDPNDDRCENIGENPDVSFELNQFEDEPPDTSVRLARVDSNGTLYDVQLEKVPEGFEGWARLTGLDGRAEIVVSPESVEIRVVDTNGNVLPAIESDQAACSDDDNEISTRNYRLEDETYRLRIFGPKQSILLSVAENCISREIVDRTCPGTQGEIAERRITVAPGEQISGRFHALDLGVGNAVSVTASCESDFSCRGIVELAPYVEPLECRGDDDCPARKSCSPDGYCLREPSGCQTASIPSPVRGGLGILSFLALAAIFRRRHVVTASGEASSSSDRLNEHKPNGGGARR